jgi:hypothetical protein
MFEVYEATLSYGKVHKSTYLLKELVVILHNIVEKPSTLTTDTTFMTS